MVHSPQAGALTMMTRPEWVKLILKFTRKKVSKEKRLTKKWFFVG